VNNTKTDTTNVYRYKITRRGVSDRDLWGRKAGEPYEEIEFRGYYQKMQSWEPWCRADEYMIVELQKLEAVPGLEGLAYLAWQTVRTKTFGEEQ
jgi:hypothetical protein